MYNPVAVGNYFIYKAIDEGMPITPMKVLKLVYIAHGWYLGLTDEPLLTEQTEAWKYGPVIRSVYHTFKIFGKEDINCLQFRHSGAKQEYQELMKDQTTKTFLDKIWEVYKDFSGTQLSNLTHQTDTPWHVTWHQNGGSLKSGAIIPNSLIRDHYFAKSQGN